ncbi:hypothetical protein PRIPAC_96404 [Pristionchus pacificus]|uniref:Uncharacterized protein n=1 Tax=Pristionchus pacificus TaxID=54126 RepID=A0A2A6CUN8_PRIPA|nr:hypothetical protein PRIPAC_96404 [Pristionchus pacificus]|eukprot:PDM81810.1 hypothetical protein PRIPAC_33964 [Pristionchus pacificus]
MMRCCRRFQSIGSASSSWKVIDFGDRSVPGDVIRRIIMRGTTVLRLCGTTIVDPIPDIDQEPFYTKLTHVDATRLSFTPQF